MRILELFPSLPLMTVEWGAAEAGAVLEGLLLGGAWSTRPVRRLEDAVRDLLGAREVLAFENGRTALEWVLSLAAARPEAGARKEVILPALLCRAAVQAVQAAGLEPVLCDVAEDLAMDPESASTLFDPSRTLAVVVPHLYGFPSRTRAFRRMTGAGGAVLIDDAAAALGARHDGIPLGLGGDAGVFSFSQGKSLTAGGGGLLVLSRESPFAGALSLRPSLKPAAMKRTLGTFVRFLWMDLLHRFSDPCETLQDSLRARLGRRKRSRSMPIEERRMAGLPALTALAQLRRIDALMRGRQRNRALLEEELADLPDLRVVEAPDGASPTRFLVETRACAVRREKSGIREDNPLVRHLLQAGIEARYAYLPLHRYAGARYRAAASLEVSERLGDRLVVLPFLPPLGRGEMARIGKAVRSFFGR